MIIDIIKISSYETIYLVLWSNIEKPTILVIITADDYKKTQFWKYKWNLKFKEREFLTLSPYIKKEKIKEVL